MMIIYQIQNMNMKVQLNREKIGVGQPVFCFIFTNQTMWMTHKIILNTT